ncbi:19490_t:CDS:2, partial [Dentiscutata erythropus]
INYYTDDDMYLESMESNIQEISEQILDQNTNVDKVGLMATVLDSRLKSMNLWPEEIREQAIIELHNEFQDFITINIENYIRSTNTTMCLTHSIHLISS